MYNGTLRVTRDKLPGESFVLLVGIHGLVAPRAVYLIAAGLYSSERVSFRDGTDFSHDGQHMAVD